MSKNYCPEQQGSLDALCGVYAALNSIGLMTDRIDLSQLFTYIVDKLDCRLSVVIIHGLDTRELRKWVLKRCAAFCAKHQIEVTYSQCAKDLPLADHWRMMQQHHRLHGAGSIVLGLSGSYNHWVCVKSITEKTLIFVDTLPSRVYRRHVGRTDNSIQIRSKDTFLLRISSMI